MKFKQHLLLLAVTGFLIFQSAGAQSRYSPSADGTELADNITGLVWQRCSQGQSWSAAASTCTGTASVHTHEAALALAQTQAGWRLPNVKELASITDLSKSSPAINTLALPATPSSYFWSSTPIVGSPGNVMVIDFNQGQVFNGIRSAAYYVRLVR